MHVSDALLSPAVGGFFGVGTLGTIAYCSKKVKEDPDERRVPLMGVVGAFIFAAQMVNFSIPGTGSSGHLTGGMILAIILGPYAAFIVMASILIVQALFFADGGLLALGCNIWNMGFYSCFIAYPFIFRLIAGKRMTSKRLLAASLLSAVAALPMGAFSVVMETFLSGRSELPLRSFIWLMLPIHLAIGFVEGCITAGVIGYVRSARPELVGVSPDRRISSTGVSVRKVVFTFLALAVITGGVVSWFASANPDGLEWSVGKVYGKPELPDPVTGLGAALKTLQEKTAFLADYSVASMRGQKSVQTSWPHVQVGTSVSGILGAFIVMGFLFAIGWIPRFLRKRKAS